MEINQTQSIVDEKKFHKLDPKKKPLYLGIGIVFITVIIPAIIYVYYNAALGRPAQCDTEKVFKIDKGEGVSSISERLYAEGLVNSKMLFTFYVVSNNLQSKIQAGTYKIPAGSTVVNLLDLFGNGRDDVRVTFLEGWRLEEVAKQAVDKISGIGYDTFLEAAKGYEGTLFPDTYDFNSDVSEQEIVMAMRANFTNRTQGLFTPQTLTKTGLTQEQVLILASIVEREVITEADRKIVAGILLKRFKEGGLVGADATTQYAVAASRMKSSGGNTWWPNNLTLDELDINSPYNTRKVAGLPPSPICSPGLGSIEAVLDPQMTEYYYYLTDSLGVTHYAKNLDEHNKNVFKYLPQ